MTTSEKPLEQVEVTYIGYMASIKCECGLDMILSQNIYNDPKYRGVCVCGKKYQLLDNKLKCVSSKNA
jgi:hypothetical protein